MNLGTSFSICFVPGTDLMVSIGKELSLWRLSSPTRLAKSRPLPDPAQLAAAPDGSSVAVKNTAGELALLDLPSLQPRWVRTVGEGCELLYSPCGRHLITGSWQGELQLLDVGTGQCHVVNQRKHTMLTWLSQSADRQTFCDVMQPKAIGGRPPGDSSVTVRRWPFGDLEGQTVDGPWRWVRAAELSGDAQRLAVLHQRPDGQFQLDVVALENLDIRSSDPFAFGGTSFSVAWAPDNRLLATVVAGEVTLLDPQSLRALASHRMPFPCHVRFSPDGTRLAMGSWKQGRLSAVQELLNVRAASTPPPWH